MRALVRLFKLTNIQKLDKTPKRCHSHMFRDTFAVELLLAGVPLIRFLCYWGILVNEHNTYSMTVTTK